MKLIKRYLYGGNVPGTNNSYDYKQQGVLALNYLLSHNPTAATMSQWVKGTLSYLTGIKDSDLIESKYTPSKASNKNAKYYTRKGLDYDVMRNLLGGKESSAKTFEGEPLYYKDFNDLYNRLSQSNGKLLRTTDNSHLGEYTIGIGQDKNGRYVSYYDKFDWAPNERLEVFSPYEIYNRIYEKDFNKMQRELSNESYSGSNPSGNWFFKSGINNKGYFKSGGLIKKAQNGTPLNSSNALGDSIKRKYLDEAISFAKDYRNSPGFKERWSKIGNKGVTRRLGSKYDPNEGYGKVLWSLSNWNTSNKVNSWNNSSNAAYFPSQGFYIGTNKNPVSAMSNWKDLLTHEVGHYFEANISPTYIDGYTKEKSPIGTYFSDLYPIFRKSKSYNDSLDLLSNDEDIKNYERDPSYKYYDLYLGGYLDGLSDSLHDGTPTESYADLFLLKKKLLDLGIYDVRKANNPFTKQHLDQFKKKNKDKVRLLDNFSDADIIWMMNNVAQNNTSTDNKYISQAKLGGKFRKFQIGGYVQPSNVQEAVSNGSAAGGLLEGFGKVMSKILPEWMLKAGTYMSPLNYAAALSKGSINPKVGEEVISKWHPNLLLAARTGEIILGGKAVKGAGKATVNTAAKAGNKTARAYLISKELNNGIKLNTKNGRIEVTDAYFNSPDKWYRVSETPEKFGIREQGKNITTTDSPQTKGTADGFRRKIIKKYKTEDGQNFILVPGKGANEGYFVRLPVRFSLTKNGAAHGNTSQAAAGQIWQGTFAQSGKFPEGIIEGQAPSKIYRGMLPDGTDSRTNFILLDWENVPKGARVGFHTGEMPMSNLGWFQKTNKGTYTYEPIIPEKRIQIETPKITKSKPYVRWSQEGYLNEAYDIDSGPGLKFQVVKDVDNPKKGILQTKGNGEYSLHFKSSRNNPNKEGMFLMLAESIPEGGIVSTWGKISKGGYHGINRFGEQFGWTKVGERPAVNGYVNMFLKPSVKHDRYVTALDEYGFPTDVPVKQYVSKRIEKLSSVAPDKVNYRFFPTIEQYTSMKQAGFTPKATITPGANLKAQMLENIRRLQKIYGETLPEDVKYKMKLQATKPIYLGYFETPLGGGVFSPASKISMIEPNPNDPLPRVMLHEAIMHGSDEFQTNYTAGLYLNFIDKIVNSPEVVKKDGKPYYYNSLFKGVIPQKMEFPYGGDKWYEGRATFGELRKLMYDRISKNKDVSVTPETIELLRPEFEKLVDAMNLEQASEALKHMNGYGYLYGEVGPKINPSFLSEFKSLIKYAPIGLPLLYNKNLERK